MDRVENADFSVILISLLALAAVIGVVFMLRKAERKTLEDVEKLSQHLKYPKADRMTKYMGKNKQ